MTPNADGHGDPTAYAFTAERRNGTVVVGRTHEHPATLVPRLFKQRYRWLSVHLDGDTVNEVGSIIVDEDTGKRVWWAEQPTSNGRRSDVTGGAT